MRSSCMIAVDTGDGFPVYCIQLCTDEGTLRRSLSSAKAQRSVSPTTRGWPLIY